jgi:predicted CXXCH cytochrome family protein
MKSLFSFYCSFKYLPLTIFAIAALFLHASIAHAQFMRNSAKECAICHFRWLDQFFVEGRGTDLVEYQKERVAGSEMICYSCHNGIMVDSRERFWAKRGHRCNMVPSQKVRIPPEMPLGEKGEIVCATCHTVHGISDELRNQETIYLRFSNRNSEMCIMCHFTKIGGKDQGNHPINVTGLSIPQKIFDLYGRTGTKGDVICETCHTVHGTTDKNLLVIPDRIGENIFTSELCEVCHGSNPSQPKKGLGMGSHPVDLTPKDARPPAVWEGGRKVALGKTEQIICETCHWPHDAAPQTSILAKKGETSICLDCHKRQVLAKGTDHDLTITAPLALNIYEKNAEIGGICSPCHIPHNAGAVKLWSRRTEKYIYADPISPLCESCHKQDKPASAKKTGRFSHPVNRGLDKIKGKTELPIFNRKGEKSADGKVTCATCHDAHKWDPSRKKPGPGIKVEGDNRNSFLRQADVPVSSLCLSCHQDKKVIMKSEHDLELSAPKEVNYLDQTVDKGGICSPCHLVHNGTSIKMWAKQMDSKDLAIKNLCFSCHMEKGCGEKKLVGSISHPTEKAMALLNADFKITLPQYDVYGERTDSQGLITCSSCHDTHKWDPRKDKRGPGKMLEGDRKNSFLRMVNDSKSSLCVSCHLKKGYVLYTDHDMMITAPKETNVLDQKAKKGGVCSACHIPHQARGIRIFAKEISAEGNPGNLLCKSCHSKEACGKEKVISAQTHPMEVRPKVSELELPLYDSQGIKDKEKGKLLCSTCHEPHQWDPKNETQGKKEKPEGTGKNSFLRMVSAPEPLLCQKCHQEQGYVVKTDHDMYLIDPNFKKGTCDACHYVHNGEPYKLWANKLDPFYTAGQGPIDLLCQSCHMQGRSGGKKVLDDGYSHPVNVSLAEKGMKTRMPLYTVPSYYPMEQRWDKELGKLLTCQTCHNVHQWSEEEQISQHNANVEGNIENSFLRQTAEGLGYLCVDCHEDKKYVIWSEHDMRLVATDSKNQLDQTVSQGGVCSPCHAVHHTPQRQILWTRSLEGERDFMLGTCVNCHKKDGAAGAKEFFIGLHPSSFVYTGKMMEQQQLKGAIFSIYYPLYDKRGNKTPTGFVTCTTCHNPHQWDPLSKYYPEKKNIEGDPTNSFLRNRGPAFSICLDCHRFEALLKYKGYHQPSEWQQKYWRKPKNNDWQRYQYTPYQ